MNNYTLKRYCQNDYSSWNAFVQKATNATFQYHRDFMEYHKDRFTDYSLMIYKGNVLVALLPANCLNNCLYSHQGLSSGGLVYGDKLKLAEVILIFKALLQFLNQNSISKIQLRILPVIYHKKPAQELEYALFLAEGQLIRRDSLSVVDLYKPFKMAKGREEGIKRGIKNSLEIIETEELQGFWEQLLIPNLFRKYGVRPVHSLEEIQSLKRRFPNHIRQFNVFDKGRLVAGTTLFESQQLIHCQYISADDSKNQSGSLDFLFYYLLSEVFKDKNYFCFGSSNGNQGKMLNIGLSFWKQSFGAGTFVQDTYEVDTANFSKLEEVFL